MTEDDEFLPLGQLNVDDESTSALVLRRSTRVKTKVKPYSSVKIDSDTKPIALKQHSQERNDDAKAKSRPPKSQLELKMKIDEKEAVRLSKIKTEEGGALQHLGTSPQVRVEQPEIITPATSLPQNSAFPASQQDGMLLLPFVYTLQRLQREAKDGGGVCLATIMSETNKLKPDVLYHYQTSSAANCLGYFQKHLDIVVTTTSEGAPCIAFRDVNLPWLTQVRTLESMEQALGVCHNQSWTSLQDNGIVALVEILYCCDTRYASGIDFRALWIYLDDYVKIVLKSRNDVRRFCEEASRTCHIDILPSKKGFRVSLCNRERPFKSNSMNNRFFERNLAAIKTFYKKHLMISRGAKRQAVNELIKKNAGKIRTVVSGDRRIVGPLDRYLV